MSRYIDADAYCEALDNTLKEALNQDEATFYGATMASVLVIAIKKALRDEELAPSIDIVFCKECRKHNTHKCHLAFDLVATNDDDFCSYGEREGE